MLASPTESSIHELGEEIFQRAEDAIPSVLSIERWRQFGMEWMAQDEDLKLRMFRFIEGLPRLKTSADVAQSLQSTLARGNGHPPSPAMLQFALAFKNPRSIFASLVAQTVRWSCEQSARQFICGQTAEEAIASVLKFRRQDMAFTLDVLGEMVDSPKMAQHHLETYLRIMRELTRASAGWSPNNLLDEAPWGAIPRVNISIKLTALAANIESMPRNQAAEAMAEPLRIIFRAARERGAFINVDMEHYAIKDVTLEVFKRVAAEDEFRDWSDCGIVVQAYLRDSARDMQGLIDWARKRATPIGVRLVKGAYWDSESASARAAGLEPPVWMEKRQSDASFERVAFMMLDASDAIRPAIGSHNVRSIAAVLSYERARDLPPRSVEVQMLAGMGDPLKRALVSMNQRVRVYAPFGDLVRGMAYLIRRLIENTSNESFLRQSFQNGPPRSVLLANPASSV